jgi:hypothetical protein
MGYGVGRELTWLTYAVQLAARLVKVGGNRVQVRIPRLRQDTGDPTVMALR